MFGLGTTELLVIAFVIVLLFGGKKLPGLGRSFGSAITNFKKGLNEADKKDEIKSEDAHNDESKNS
jgi:sec-independent protein translocase protein TatA